MGALIRNIPPKGKSPQLFTSHGFELKATVKTESQCFMKKVKGEDGWAKTILLFFAKLKKNGEICLNGLDAQLKSNAFYMADIAFLWCEGHEK